MQDLWYAWTRDTRTTINRKVEHITNPAISHILAEGEATRILLNFENLSHMYTVLSGVESHFIHCGILYTLHKFEGIHKTFDSA